MVQLLTNNDTSLSAVEVKVDLIIRNAMHAMGCWKTQINKVVKSWNIIPIHINYEYKNGQQSMSDPYTGIHRSDTGTVEGLRSKVV